LRFIDILIEKNFDKKKPAFGGVLRMQRGGLVTEGFPFFEDFFDLLFRKAFLGGLGGGLLRWGLLGLVGGGSPSFAGLLFVQLAG
jgi:hypothetical protein